MMKIIIFLRWGLVYSIGTVLILFAFHLMCVTPPYGYIEEVKMGFFQYQYRGGMGMMSLYDLNNKVSTGLPTFATRIYYIDDTGRYIYYVADEGFGVIDYWQKPNIIYIYGNPAFLKEVREGDFTVNKRELKEAYGNSVHFLEDIQCLPEKHKQYFLAHKEEIRLKVSYRRMEDAEKEWFMEAFDRLIKEHQ